MTFWLEGIKDTFVQGVKAAWEWSGQVPDCPCCHGTGEPSVRWRHLATPVYWKGAEYWVCHACDGRGKR